MTDPPTVVDRLRAAGCVFAEEEARLLEAAATTPAELDSLVERRAWGLPLEQLLGWAEFCGLRIRLAPGVFVPRRRSRFLVREAATAAKGVEPPAVVVDLCCGSGAVGVAVREAVGTVELYAVDIDPAAVQCARLNVTADRVYEGDLFEPLPHRLRGRIDVAVAVPPYVPTGELGLMPREAREHEPAMALDGGGDGLDVLRRIARAAPEWLRPGGRLLLEIAEHQAPAATAAFSAVGLTATIARSRKASATVVVGQTLSSR
ncbi:MAG: putative protein N(5)-glutamine methyltransferase [Nocardioidaceae bacterium]